MRSPRGKPRRCADATEAAAAREQLLPFLLNRLSYPHRPRQVSLVQTHASFVFIAPPFVYKVKKPVNFGFLNFSTLEKRRHFCDREVMLNRRLCPGIYFGVVPISTKDGRLTFGEGEAVVEYAVKMRKLSDGRFLDQLVERGAVKRADFNRIVAMLKKFYEAQHPSAEIEAWGRVSRLRISTDENFRQASEFIGHTISSAAFETIRAHTNGFYRRHAGLFASRIRARRIRDCHGDLHLEHIHLTPRAIHIYDCIEFNDRFRHVDVASDAAFLAMDLDYEGRPDLARHFARRMAATLGDDGMPSLMDFYKCYRAFVRGKVESLHSVAPAAPDAERESSADRARRYFRLALRYAVAGSEPLVLAVMGRIASGKSTLARALGDELGWQVFSSDRVRKQIAGFPLFERISAAGRARLYSAAMTRKTYARLFAAAETEARAGRSVILDATFARREHRAALRKRFSGRGIPFQFVEARASDATIKRRLRVRETSPEEVSDARLEDFTMLTRLYEAPAELQDGQCVPVSTAGKMTKSIQRALRAIATRYVAPSPTRGSIKSRPRPRDR